MSSALSPRDIQARIRAGASLEEVAEEAGAPVEKVEPFAAPVLAERYHVAGTAETSPVRRSGEASNHRTLRTVVHEALLESKVDLDDVEWDAWRVADRKWCVRVTWPEGTETKQADFLYDQLGRFSIANDDASRALLGEKGTQGRGEDADREPTVDFTDEFAIVRAVQVEAVPEDVPAEREEAPRPARQDDRRSARRDDDRRSGDLAGVDLGSNDLGSSDLGGDDFGDLFADAGEEPAGVYQAAPDADTRSELDNLYDMLHAYEEDSVSIYRGLDMVTPIGAPVPAPPETELMTPTEAAAERNGAPAAPAQPQEQPSRQQQRKQRRRGRGKDQRPATPQPAAPTEPAQSPTPLSAAATPTATPWLQPVADSAIADEERSSREAEHRQAGVPPVESRAVQAASTKPTPASGQPVVAPPAVVAAPVAEPLTLQPTEAGVGAEPPVPATEAAPLAPRSVAADTHDAAERTAQPPAGAESAENVQDPTPSSPADPDPMGGTPVQREVEAEPAVAPQPVPTPQVAQPLERSSAQQPVAQPPVAQQPNPGPGPAPALGAPDVPTIVADEERSSRVAEHHDATVAPVESRAVQAATTKPAPASGEPVVAPPAVATTPATEPLTNQPTEAAVATEPPVATVEATQVAPRSVAADTHGTTEPPARPPAAAESAENAGTPAPSTPTDPGPVGGTPVQGEVVDEPAVAPQPVATPEPEQHSLLDDTAQIPMLKRSTKKKRATVPSWDEIMFGGPTPKKKD